MIPKKNLFPTAGLRSYYSVTKNKKQEKSKTKSYFYRHPYITELKKEILNQAEEFSNVQADLGDLLAEYEAYDKEDINQSLINDFPLKSLRDFCFYELGEKQETNLSRLIKRKFIRKEIEQCHQELMEIDKSLFEKEIDLIIAKTKVLLSVLDK